MVWLHGGSYIYGSGGSYDGHHLARDGDVVVVTLNYRLGALGTFAHPALDSSLNFGMLDEMHALQWVRDNISAFGGNPSNITIFGESAGGASVCALVTSSASSGLFDKAIMQSGTCSWTPRQRALDAGTCGSTPACPDLATIDADGLYNCVSMECLGTRIADALDCDATADPMICLREADALEVLAALPQNIGYGRGVLWGRFLDGETIATAPGEALYNGDFQRVPFMLGTTRDEATLFFSPTGPDVTTVDGLGDYIGLWGACADEISAHYPAADDVEATAQYLRLLADYTYTCPTNWDAQSVSFYQPDVWLYQFTHVPWAGGIDINAQGFRLGAYHSAEIPYVFGNIIEPAKDPACVADASGAFHCCDDIGRCFEPIDVAFGDEMMRLWTAFAHAGDPGASWPRYDLMARRHLMLEPDLPQSAQLRTDVCDMWLTVSSHFVDGAGACD
jgi:para-nitrobenzyl esterase